MSTLASRLACDWHGDWRVTGMASGVWRAWLYLPPYLEVDPAIAPRRMGRRSDLPFDRFDAFHGDVTLMEA